jgi:transcriptional regulator with XRE-family HTH domain
MQIDKALSIYLKRLRLDHNDERLIDMANKLNISQSFLSAIESGKRNLSDKLVQKIVEVYGLDEMAERELIHLRDLTSHKINVTLENLEKELLPDVKSFLGLNKPESKEKGNVVNLDIRKTLKEDKL